MIDIDQALHIVLDRVTPLETVEMPLGEALYRTLAAPIICDIDAPPFDRSVMDGYAVRSVDVAAVPVTLQVVGHVAAGAVPKEKVQSGQAVQINTGAPLPPGADAVVRVEHTTPGASPDQVVVREPASPGQFITRRGTYVAAGETVLEKGSRLTPPAVGAAAAAGAARVTVRRRPQVAVLSTGSELVPVDAKPTGGQIRNSNEALLSALVGSAHAMPIAIGFATDDRSVLVQRIEQGLRADVLCLTGGVSMGAFDFVPGVLEECGATFHVHKIAIKPGRPTIFASVPDGPLIFALPGNPGSAFVGFELLVRPALAALEGQAEPLPRPVRAVVTGSIAPTGKRRSFIPGRAVVDGEGCLQVEALRWAGSGDTFGLARANALIMRPPDSAGVRSGEQVLVYLLRACG